MKRRKFFMLISAGVTQRDQSIPSAKTNDKDPMKLLACQSKDEITVQLTMVGNGETFDITASDVIKAIFEQFRELKIK